MQQAIERIVKALVGNPDDVAVTESGDSKNVRIGVRVHADDYGRLIGREGRTIRAIRSVLFFGGMKNGKRYQLDLIEDR